MLSLIHVYTTLFSPWNEKLNLLVQMKFLNLFSYISKWKLKNLLVQITKVCWSWARGPVFIVRTDWSQMHEKQKYNILKEERFELLTVFLLSCLMVFNATFNNISVISWWFYKVNNVYLVALSICLQTLEHT